MQYAGLGSNKTLTAPLGYQTVVHDIAFGGDHGTTVEAELMHHMRNNGVTPQGTTE